MNVYIPAKKSLGQNFLKSTFIAQTIVSESDVKKSDFVLEIGPGKGILTKILLEKGASVIAFEKDDRLSSYLSEKFQTEIKNGRLKIIHDDIFHLKKYNVLPLKYKVIANIPYYITGKIIPFLFHLQNLPEQITLLLQYEVAKRILGKEKESILSLSVKAFSTPVFIKKVSKKFFSPEPKVDSGIISFTNISRSFFKMVSEESFFSLIKKGFGSKRKFLKNNIGYNKNAWDACGISEKARAEDLSLEQWACLVQYYE